MGYPLAPKSPSLALLGMIILVVPFLVTKIPGLDQIMDSSTSDESHAKVKGRGETIYYLGANIEAKGAPTSPPILGNHPRDLIEQMDMPIM